MTKIWLATATALTLTMGVAAAQMTETTTTETTRAVPAVPLQYVPVPVPPPAPPMVSQTTNERTVDENGYVTDHTRTVTSGTAMTPYGDTVTTRKTIEVTTTR